jgi:hypothetical protein
MKAEVEFFAQRASEGLKNKHKTFSAANCHRAPFPEEKMRCARRAARVPALLKFNRDFTVPRHGEIL